MGAQEGGHTFDGQTFENRLQAHDLWHAVWKNIRTEIMPPSDVLRPSLKERRAITKWIEESVFRLDPEYPDPGKVVLRRLNRDEYRNTIFDMLGIEFDSVDAFPPDDTGYGFDTVGETLNTSPLLIEKYLRAARSIANEAVFGESMPRGSSKARWSDKRIFFDGPPPEDPGQRQEYRREILRRFAERAFRRPVNSSTLDRLVTFSLSAEQKHDQSFEQGIAHGITAILASPRFLYRTEKELSALRIGTAVALDEYSLASRLSYLLWRSLPDDELLTLASKSELRQNPPHTG